MSNNQTTIIGLTGGIASGKTAVSDILAGYGIPIVDADVLARLATADGSYGARLIEDAFPTVVTGGVIDRAKLRRIAFSDKANADKLDGITHPIIIELIKTELIRHTKEGAPKIVLVAPLLFETKLDKLCHKTIQISANQELRIKRAQIRDGVSKSNIEAIMIRQLSDNEREKLADITLDNNGSAQDLRRQVEQICCS